MQACSKNTQLAKPKRKPQKDIGIRKTETMRGLGTDIQIWGGIEMDIQTFGGPFRNSCTRALWFLK